MWPDAGFTLVCVRLARPSSWRSSAAPPFQRLSGTPPSSSSGSGNNMVNYNFQASFFLICNLWLIVTKHLTLLSIILMQRNLLVIATRCKRDPVNFRAWMFALKNSQFWQFPVTFRQIGAYATKFKRLQRVWMRTQLLHGAYFITPK